MIKQLPNILTISRIFLTLIFIFCLLQPGVWPIVIATVLFALASLTDFYDGYYAKKYNLTSNFGKIMDPIADKFLILAAFFIFVVASVVPLWMFYVIFVRELFVTGTRLTAIRRQKFIAAEKAGKLKTVSQVTVIFTILLFLMLQESAFQAAWKGPLIRICANGISVLLFLTLALTVWSGVSYLWNNRRILLSKV